MRVCVCGGGGGGVSVHATITVHVNCKKLTVLVVYKVHHCIKFTQGSVYS